MLGGAKPRSNGEVVSELVDRMVRDPRKYSTEPRNEILSVLFADLRGFTTIAETLAPHELRVFRAMALYNVGRSKEAMSSLLDVINRTTQDAALRRFVRPPAAQGRVVHHPP